MGKRLLNVLLVVFVFLPMTLMLIACDGEKIPNEEVLVTDGVSLKEALPKFKELEDNYTYRQKLWQTNGEDWFSYNIVKLYENDIYVQSRYYYGNAGWQIENEAFVIDSENKAYTVYLEIDNNYTIYRKYKYNDTDEEFQYRFHAYNFSDNNIEAARFHLDYSFLNEEWFEYLVMEEQDNSKSKIWKIKDEVLNDSTFRTSLLTCFKRDTESINEDRIDFVFFYLKDNLVTDIVFAYWNQYLQHHYHIEMHFSYDDYSFDQDNLTTGFTPYIPEE
ncbi:MAG: hypothetical protein PHW21_03160 [Candidatus Izemoplasmatales bacterium]|nr:hypothetical protein [Candidatus Izemoplasmatales bacterium]